jgi:uncharacterized tellurite resistance protein B-like protein
MPPFMLYLIIFGTRGVTYSAAEGQFHCPDCGQSPYRHRRVRRFFTLYFIPLIPLDMLGEYVECGACQGTYQLGVLSYNPGAEAAAFEAQFHIAIRRTMVLMCLADGVVDPEEVATIQRVFGQIAKRQITAEEVHAEIASAQSDGRPVHEFLAGGIAATLNDSGKEMVIRAAFMVAAADGQFQDEEKQLLAQIGSALQMTPAHLNGVIDSMIGDGTQA